MIRAIVNSQLQVSPADTACPSRTGTKSPGAWFEVANLSPYAFELLDDAGQVRGIAGPFAYTAVPMSVVSDHITLHAVGTLVPSPPLAAPSWVVYAGLTKNPGTPTSVVGGTPAGTGAAPSFVRITDPDNGQTAAVLLLGQTDATSVAQPSLQTGSFGLLLNNQSWDRARSASPANLIAQNGLGAALQTGPGLWSAVHTPAAGTKASASRAAGAAGVRHICRGFIITFGAIAAPVATLLQWNLRDGASGLGTILASGQVAVPALATFSDNIPIGPIDIPGSLATAMTLEFSAALANLAQGVTLFGYDV